MLNIPEQRILDEAEFDRRAMQKSLAAKSDHELVKIATEHAAGYIDYFGPTACKTPVLLRELAKRITK